MNDVEPQFSKDHSFEAPSRLRQVLAWGVHFYTGLGVVLAGGMAILIIRGTPYDLAWVFGLMFIAVFIDATDGMLARAVRVKKVLPGFDGTLLDNIIDFLTYTFLPLLLLWRAGIVPEDMAWVLALPLMASAYGFCQVRAKTADGYFRGFPSYWNIVAFYLYLFQAPVGVTVGLLWLLAFLTFVPSLYLYPSRGGSVLDVLANVLGAVWGVQLIWILVDLLVGIESDPVVPPSRTLVLASLPYPVFYMVVSWWVTLRRWTGKGKVPHVG